jgi:hypothetical protein
MNKNYDTIIYKAECNALIRINLVDNKLTDQIYPMFNKKLYDEISYSTLLIGSFDSTNNFNEFGRIDVKNQKERKIELYKKDNLHKYINSILENLTHDGNT